MGIWRRLEFGSNVDLLKNMFIYESIVLIPLKKGSPKIKFLLAFQFFINLWLIIKSEAYLPHGRNWAVSGTKVPSLKSYLADIK